MASLDLVRLREDLEAFQSSLMEEFYNNYAGLKDEMSTVPIYGKYAHLFSKETLGQIDEKAAEELPPEDARCMAYLKAFSTSGFIDNAVKEFTDRANTFEAQSVVSFDGEEIAYRFVPIKLRSEPDRTRRGRLFEAKLKETAKLNEILLIRMTAAHQLSESLGFKNYRDLMSVLKKIDYRSLEGQMEEMLHRTESPYTAAMEKLLLEKAGVALSEAWSYDIPYVFKGDEYNKYFDKDKLVPAFFDTLKRMGIEPERYSNITIDAEDRPKKTPRAFCSPVRIPSDVRLVIRPVGGWKDYDAFFHEGGHAWHFGNTHQDLPPEYRYLGDNSVTEAFAFLFNYLPSNRFWLEDRLGMKEIEEYVRFSLVNKLMFLRRYASKLVYEMKLHQKVVTGDMGDVYRNCLQRGLKFRHTELHYLEDVDDGFYCAEYLRAWILEGQLREAMEDKFGERWFSEPRAGEYLRELWSYGQKYNADELVKTLGYGELDFEPVIMEIEKGLVD